MLYTIARKTHSVDRLSTPQQQDYAQAWSANANGAAYVNGRRSARSTVASWVRRRLPPPVERWGRMHFTPGPEAQPDCFRRLTDDEIVRGRFQITGQ
jgi:hypothetical protein